MKYSVMKIVCMFDLPVDTEKEKKAYRKFRKRLVEEGFLMVQYSVYVRTCPTREYASRLQTRMKTYVPENGNIRLLSVTEKQYDDMFLLVGKKKKTEEVVGTKRLIVL